MLADVAYTIRISPADSTRVDPGPVLKIFEERGSIEGFPGVHHVSLLPILPSQEESLQIQHPELRSCPDMLSDVEPAADRIIRRSPTNGAEEQDRPVCWISLPWRAQQTSLSPGRGCGKLRHQLQISGHPLGTLVVSARGTSSTSVRRNVRDSMARGSSCLSLKTRTMAFSKASVQCDLQVSEVLTDLGKWLK